MSWVITENAHILIRNMLWISYARPNRCFSTKYRAKISARFWKQRISSQVQVSVERRRNVKKRVKRRITYPGSRRHAQTRAHGEIFAIQTRVLSFEFFRGDSGGFGNRPTTITGGDSNLFYMKGRRKDNYQPISSVVYRRNVSNIATQRWLTGHQGATYEYRFQ
jgi:hypothetical protein